MADGVLDLDLVKDGAVVELNEESVSNGTFGGLVVLGAEAGVLDAVNLGTECIDARISS